jgi:excisionase family DNA binding protein
MSIPVKPRRVRPPATPASRQTATRVSKVPPPLGFEPLVVRRAEAARMLRIGQTLLKELIRDGKLRETRLGSASLIHVASIRALLGIEP